MENRYLIAALIVIVASTLAISAGAHNTDGYNNDMMGMGGMMGMMQGNFVHDQDDIDWMRKEMKEHMNFTDEEFGEMAEHCPMMRGR